MNREPHDSILAFCEDSSHYLAVLNTQWSQFTPSQIDKAIVELCFEGRLEVLDRGKKTECYQVAAVEEVGGGRY